MQPVRCVLLRISLSLIAGVVGISGKVRAQGPDASGEGTKLVDVSGPKKPVHKLNEVPTTDSVVLLGVKRATAKDSSAVAAQSVSATSPEVVVAADPAEETKKKAAEITSLQKQIQEKMARIALLMRLFVSDEKAFVIDPSNPQGDVAARDQRKYSQDELLWETAELAKLKARLNEITGAR